MVLGQLTFNLGISSPQQCQGCTRTLSFRFSYPSENITAINWYKGLQYSMVAYAYYTDGQLVLYPTEFYHQRLSYEQSDPGSFTLMDVHYTDTDNYWCYVLFESQNYIIGSTFLNVSESLCKSQIIIINNKT